MQLDDSFYIDYLRKKYPKEPEKHSLQVGLIALMKEVYTTEPQLHTVVMGKQYIRAVVNRGKGTVKKSKFERKQIAQLLADTDVEVEGILVDRIETKSYIGCPKCKKKACAVHGEKMVPIYFHQFILADDTSEITVAFGSMEQEFNAVDSGDRVIVRGRCKLWGESLNLHVYEHEILARAKVDSKAEAIQKQLKHLKEVGIMRKVLWDEGVKLSNLTDADFGDKIRIIDTEDGKGVEYAGKD